MKTITGKIIAIQEERFRILTDAGQGYLLTLAKSAPVSPFQLDVWRRAGVLVEVQFTGQPDLVSGVASDVRSI